MRDRVRLELSPRAYADAKEAERQRNLASVLETLRRARLEGAEWYLEALRVASETRARCSRPSSEPRPPAPPRLPRYAIDDDGTLRVTARVVLNAGR